MAINVLPSVVPSLATSPKAMDLKPPTSAVNTRNYNYANYYGSRQQTLVGPATVKAIVFTNYGRPNESCQEITLRLEIRKMLSLVGTVELDEAVLQAEQIPNNRLQIPNHCNELQHGPTKAIWI